MKNVFVNLLLLFLPLFLFSQDFQQPAIGPGSATYQHDSIVIYDYAKKQDGYWLFEPALPRPETAPVIVFIHGYGGYNPMIYGQWIRHLVRQGNIVIYPRYQKNMTMPSPKRFSKNVVTAIHDALAVMKTPIHITPIVEDLCMVGHSYGGIIGADITVHWRGYELPKPKGLFLCAPGTGPLKAGRLDTYSNMPEDLKLLIMINDKDYVVGDEMGLKIFETAVNTPNRNLLRQSADPMNGISAGHNETYCIDETFDSGVRNYTAKKALRITKTNAVDYYGYWKLFDALLACSRAGQHCEFAFGDTPQQVNLGVLDGEQLKKLEAMLPDDSAATFLSDKEN